MDETVLAFDAKSFTRGKRRDDQTPSYSEFYTPLGVGVRVENVSSFTSQYHDAVGRLFDSFGIEDCLTCCDSTNLKRLLGMRRAIPFVDQLVQDLESHISKIFISYVILPPSRIPHVEVGGYRCSTERIATQEFLRTLEPMFSYLAAWSYSRERMRNDEPMESTVMLDNFASKETRAWSELLSRCTPKIYIRGDECNEVVSLADNLAFLTNAKLYSQDEHELRKLEPSNLEAIWADYDFETEVRFLDDNLLSKYRWNHTQLVDTSPYIARPIVFLLIDTLAKEVQVFGEPNDDAIVEALMKKKPEFRQGVEPYHACVKYANSKGGCVKFYSPEDRMLVGDGDVLVYMGHNAKRICEVFENGFDVEVYKVKELRKKVGV